MATFSRLAFAFGAPAILMASAIGVVWLSTSRVDTVMGPSRPVLYTPPSEPAFTPEPYRLQAPAPPPNIDEPTPAWQAQARNALIPFAKAPHLSAARFVATADREPPAEALQCLTSAVYYEAGAEPEAGKRAVAQVVINRWASRAFPKTICSVVHQGAPAPGCQFSFMCDGALARKPSPQGWADAEMVARAALNGYVESSIGAATHYHADYVVPVWASTMLKLVKLGRHIFYRWPGADLSTVRGEGDAIAPPPPPPPPVAAPSEASSALETPVGAAAPTAARSGSSSPAPQPAPSEPGDAPAAFPKGQSVEPASASPAAAPSPARALPQPRDEAPRRPIPPPSLRVGPL